MRPLGAKDEKRPGKRNQNESTGYSPENKILNSETRFRKRTHGQCIKLSTICSFFTIRKVGEWLEKLTMDKCISILNQNIRSLRKNVDYIKETLSEYAYPPTIIALTETWHSQDTSFNTINGYQGYFSSKLQDKIQWGGHFRRGKRRSCGKKKQDQIYCFDVLTVELKLAIPAYVSAIYNSPSNTYDQFLNDFEEFLNNVNCGKPVVVVGDFNIDILNT